jgi:hypothetical protein
MLRTITVLTLVVAACVGLLGPGTARAQIYRCEAPNGVIEYSNAPSSRSDRTCRAVDLPPVSTIPAPVLPKAPTQAAPSEPARAGAVPSFPRIDSATQRARDSDRRRILQDELQREETRLAELRSEYNAGEPERRGDERNYQKYLDRVQRLKDEITRSQDNIALLKQELSALRD